jgi:PAS domain-containing protein
LRLSESRYRLLVSNLPGLSVALFDGDLNAQFVDGPLLSQLGIASQQLVGHRIDSVLNPDDAAFEAAMRAALEGKPDTIEHTLRNHGIMTAALPLRD